MARPTARVTLSGDLHLAERVGAGLTEGAMRVEGNVGDRAGAGLRGGRLEIAGNAGHSTGEGMSAVASSSFAATPGTAPGPQHPGASAA